jgi:hypothetical protein
MVNGLLGFDSRMPYASYNWEVYLHAPLYVASQFARQQRFQDADRWFRFVFDPTSGEGGPGPARLMRFRPFRDLIGNGGARGELEALARITASEARGLGPTAQMHEAVARIRHMIARWRDEPYRPFAIARRRHAAFLWRTVYAYVDNLIAWADDLFRRDTRESISEATLLYGLAARILGRRPRVSGSATGRTPRTYDELEARLDAFGNAWIAAQGPRPVGPRPPAVEAGNGGPVEYAPPEPGVLYFCLPFNEKLLTLWDTVEDRLFKIRHCRSIDGIARNLPFIDPPIDPGLLVRATAAGLDVESVLAGLYAPPARQRFPLLLSRALELVGEVRGLSAAVLSALEKRDSEALSRLRSNQEVELLNRIRSVRSQQIEEASQAVVALRKSREIAESRFVYLCRLLGLDDITAPGRGERRGEIPLLRMPTSDTGLAPEGLGLIQEEADQYTALQGAYDWSLASSVTKTAAGAVFAFGGLPDPYGKVVTALGHAASAAADAFAMASAGWRNYVERVGMVAAQLRRRDEWAHQANQTLGELAQIDEQLLATELRLAIVTAERDNHVRQIEHAETVAAYLREKFTSEELHDWMAGELTGLAGQTYRMTLMLARQAQQAAVRELGLQANDLSVISAQHGGEGRGVLLAAERLQQELRRLEIAYHDQNRRLHEMTKHVSLRLLDAEAFAMLKLDGTAQFELPEWLFDLDMPGHFGRRIKSVSLSIPCIVGPYASVNCKLTLLRHDVRIVPTTQPAYARLPDDRRFVTSYGPIESIVTSSGRDDSGLFELSLRDDRYLPFEHAGVISRWRVQIPSPQFDLATISDVILHIRYTAREDESLGAALVASAAASPVTGSVLLSLRDDFSAEWDSARAGTGTVEITVDTKLLPYALRRGRAVISKVSALRIRRNGDGLIEPASDWERVATAPGPVSLAGLAGLEDCLLAVHVGSGP